METKRLLIGMGNEFRGDDGIGPAVIWEMRQRQPDLFDYHTVGEDLTVLLDVWKGREVIIVDAILDDTSEAGTIRISQSMREWLDNRQSVFSSHSLTLDGIFQMGAELGKVPEAYVLVGVVGKEWKMGASLSEEVRNSIPDVVSRILELN